MSVLLCNTVLGVRRRDDSPAQIDAHGYRIPGAPVPLIGPWPGRSHERADGGWTLGVDPAAWPLRAGDLVVEVPGTGTGTTWTVLSAELLINVIDPVVNYVRVEARERKTGGTEPGGTEFIGR